MVGVVVVVATFAWNHHAARAARRASARADARASARAEMERRAAISNISADSTFADLILREQSEMLAQEFERRGAQAPAAGSRSSAR